MKLHPVLLATLVAMPLQAQTDVETEVLQQLRCTQPPSPLPVLQALENLGKLNPDQISEMDSVACFPIKDGIEIAGLTFVSVCGFEQDADIRKQRPDLLRRGPGTSPGQTLSFGTYAPEDEVSQWYTNNIGSKLMAVAIETDPLILENQIEVTCSSWISG